MGLDAIVFFKCLLPYITNTETAIGLVDGFLLAVLQVGALKVFNVVNGADKVGDVALLFEDGQGVGAEAVLGVIDVVAFWVGLEKGDELFDALLDDLVDVFVAGSGGDGAGLEWGGAVEALVVFVEGENAGVVAEFGEGLGELQSVDDAATGFGGVGEEGDAEGHG